MQQEKIIPKMIDRKFSTRLLIEGELETSKFYNGKCISSSMDYDKVFFRISNFECILVDNGAMFSSGRHTVLAAKTHSKMAEQIICKTINFEVKYKKELEDFCAQHNRKWGYIELSLDEIRQIQRQYIQNLKNRKKLNSENSL